MPSSKGEPTDPELREQIKEEVKAEEKGMPMFIVDPVFDIDSSVGGGKGNWSAWKAAEMSRRYEARGGDYIDKGDHKNKAKKGEPEKKPDAK